MTISVGGEASRIEALSAPPNAVSLAGSYAFAQVDQPDLGAVLGDVARGVGRPDLDAVLRDYQVVDDTMMRWTPNIGPLPVDVPFVGSRQMTTTEAQLLDGLGQDRGLLGLSRFREITSNDPNDPGLAYATADERFPQVDADGNLIRGGEDGHNDAFRHAYWSALMTREFGEDFAEALGTAHEGVPGNPADKEAMDLFNNELGRRIVLENPNASEDELADLVEAAVRNGEAVVIDGSGELAFSDRIPVGATGSADDPPATGRLTPDADAAGS